MTELTKTQRIAKLECEVAFLRGAVIALRNEVAGLKGEGIRLADTPFPGWRKL